MAFMNRCTARAHADCLLRQILESTASDEDLQVCRHCEATLDDLDVVAEEVGQRLRAESGDEFTHETGLRDAAKRIQNLLVDGDSGKAYPSGDTFGHPSGAAANAVVRRIQIGRLFGSAGMESAESQPPSPPSHRPEARRGSVRIASDGDFCVDYGDVRDRKRSAASERSVPNVRHNKR